MLVPNRRSRLVRWLAPDVFTTVFRVLWIVAVVYAEIGTFYLADVRWPDASNGSSKSLDKPTHVLLVADTKVTPPADGRRTFRQILDDAYLRKAWSTVSRSRPQIVIFLGDMLSAGYAVDDDDEFGTYVSRFHSLFPIPRGTVAYYVPGNTDVGLGVSSQFTRYVRERYRTHFGSLNREVRVANHSLVILDAPGLVDEDYLRAGQSVPFDQWQPIPHGPIDFVRRTSGLLRERHHDNLASEPVILLTHIPLHRAESKRCGPLREKGSIRRGVGKGWQATLGKDTSRFLLETLQPTAAFSADDRDYCEITHALLAKGEEIREITVKSFSPSRHIKRPGFQLLSLLPSESHPRHVSMPCFLPPATLPIASVYFPFLTIHVIISLIVAIRIPQRRAKAFASPLPTSAVDSSIAFSNLHAPISQAAGSIKSYLGSHAIAPSLTAPPSKGSISGEKTHDGRTGSDDLRSSLSFIPVPDGALPYGYSSRANAVRRPRLRVPVTDVGRAEHPKWTWTFTFRGQRRRFAIQVPAWLYPLKNVGGRENVWRAVWRDLRRTLWIPFSLWALLLWWYS